MVTKLLRLTSRLVTSMPSIGSSDDVLTRSYGCIMRPSSFSSSSSSFVPSRMVSDLGLENSLMDLGMMKGRKVGFLSEEVLEAMAFDLDEAALVGSGLTDFGKSFLTIGGGVDRFLVLGFSKFDARELNAGDRPLTRGLSEVRHTLRDRCDFSGVPVLPPMAILLLGCCQ